MPDLGSLGTFCFVSEHIRRRAEGMRGWRFAAGGLRTAATLTLDRYADQIERALFAEIAAQA